jgi:hypothetical protein
LHVADRDAAQRLGEEEEGVRHCRCDGVGVKLRQFYGSRGQRLIGTTSIRAGSERCPSRRLRQMELDLARLLTLLQMLNGELDSTRLANGVRLATPRGVDRRPRPKSSNHGKSRRAFAVYLNGYSVSSVFGLSNFTLRISVGAVVRK